MTKKIKLPAVKASNALPQKTLPYNGSALTEKRFAFSFACFDRVHPYFNLGDDGTPDGAVSGKWFLDLLDCLKSVSNHTISELRSSIHDLHPIDWSKTNARPHGFDYLEYWQFRISKSKGRVIGFKIENTFYVVWLDPHHNLTDSEGYEKAKKRRPPSGNY